MSKPVRPTAGFSHALTRRRFLKQSAGLAAALSLPLRAAQPSVPREPKLHAAIIGHTGHGDYGHSHDTIFNGRANITVVAVADPDEAGRAKAAARAGALRSYADYHEMFKQERPQLVAVTPRWTDQHHDMAAAALHVGAHVYLEKPITQTLAEADDLLAIANRAGLRIAVAHQMRLAPNVLFLKQRLADGLIGDLLEIRACGKQDKRAGGEDLVVLGVHEFDLMRFFAGDPLWCSARVMQEGHEITLRDAHAATEHIGPVAGDDIDAQFAFPNGVNASFISRARNRAVADHWNMELIGTKGTAKILMDIAPRVYALKNSGWTAQGKTSEWRPLHNDPTLGLSALEMSVARANQRVVDDWLAAITENRDPICSGYAGMKALEMAMAVFAAGLGRQRVDLPLKDRQHPLR
jgi:predicted dehydrogenase